VTTTAGQSVVSQPTAGLPSTASTAKVDQNKGRGRDDVTYKRTRFWRKSLGSKS